MKIKSWICLTMTLIVGIAFAEDRDLVSVKGTGTGITETEALKDAYRDAVETAVGLYVDAEQMVKNDEIVEDKILTQSNAYIESYDVLKKSTANGVCTIKILAKVKTKALTKKLSSTMKTQTVEVGSGLRNLYANEVSKKKCGEDGAVLLKKVLDKLDPIRQMIDVSLTDVEPIVFNKDDDKANELKMAYLFKSVISEERYFAELVPQLREILSQITLSEPGKMTLAVSGRETFNLNKCLGGRSPESIRSIDYFRGYQCDATISSDSLGNMQGYSGESRLSSMTKAYVILVVKVNKLHTIYTCETYEVDKYAGKVFDEWMYAKFYNAKDPYVRVTFEDEEGEELVQKSVMVDYHQSLKSCGLKGFSRGGNQNFLVFAPWFVDSNSSCFERYAWRQVSLAKDALPLIKKIKVALVK